MTYREIYEEMTWELRCAELATTRAAERAHRATARQLKAAYVKMVGTSARPAQCSTFGPQEWN